MIMIHTTMTIKGSLRGGCLYVGFLLLGIGMVLSPQTFGALPPLVETAPIHVSPFAMEQAGLKTWAAFHSTNAKNLCVRVSNSGTQDMKVWLFQSKAVVGLFTVLPQQISVMCTMANKIEVGCSGNSCESTWAVFDAQ